jgi:DNA invertase Pin-like site-specific DNA recombinase
MVGAVIYVRVSTKEQTENLSLPTQLRASDRLRLAIRQEKRDLDTFALVRVHTDGSLALLCQVDSRFARAA